MEFPQQIQDRPTYPLVHDFLNILRSQAYLTARTQHIIHATHKRRVTRLFTLSARLPVNSRLSVVKFWGGSQVIHGFPAAGHTLSPALFKGQVYEHPLLGSSSELAVASSWKNGHRKPLTKACFISVCEPRFCSHPRCRCLVRFVLSAPKRPARTSLG